MGGGAAITRVATLAAGVAPRIHASRVRWLPGCWKAIKPVGDEQVESERDRGMFAELLASLMCAVR